ncbi:BglG family transcription antiterminator [Clostridium ganghwense]|uniref:PRD domain-containing protein n=1 Tax=Clostridium ganghwense TaxID=312089 RepID=A0ABT4CPU6_9CLOT|nr:PRD domain-containing protein [Clostridium ganghwense]MCY6371070.1 PRD domain-containing protein [Clostridium ganghwense]
MIEEKVLKIIKYLYTQHEEAVSSNQIASVVGVSSRTIKRELKALISNNKDNFFEIISSNKGYKLLVKDYDKFNRDIEANCKNNLSEINTSNKTRIILMAVILVIEEHTTTEKIGDKLFLSRSTVSKDICEVKKLLEIYHLKLSNKPYYGYYVEGQETNKRKFLATYLEEVILKNIDTLELENLISLARYMKIKDEIIKVIIKNGICKHDNYINLIQRYTAVIAMRVNNRNIISLDEKEKITVNVNTINSAKEIAKIIEKTIKIELPIDEIIYISFIIGNTYVDDSLSLASNKLILKDKNLLELVNKFLEEVFNVIKLDFRNDIQLINGLAAHLNSSLGRYCVGSSIYNPMIDLIKSKYIESYNCALICNKILKYEYDITLSEDDIVYIALHFAASIERNRGHISRICIICKNGIGFSQLVKSKLEEKISNISIVDTIPTYMIDNIQKNEYDLIISTIDLNNKDLDIPILKINYDLEEKDILNIKNYIDKFSVAKHFFRKIPNELLFLNKEYESKKELFDSVLSEMVKGEYITENEANDILNREELSETIINEVVALPHCIKSGENIGAIVTLKKPLRWKTKKVKLVILCCINPKLEIEKKLFPIINKKTKDKEVLNKILESKNIEDIINVFTS